MPTKLLEYTVKQLKHVILFSCWIPGKDTPFINHTTLVGQRGSGNFCSWGLQEKYLKGKYKKRKGARGLENFYQ